MVPGWQKRCAQAPGLSLFLHHLGLNPYIPMVRWLWLCPCEVLGAQWGHPTCTGAGRVQDSQPGQGQEDSRRPRELGWCSPAELCCSVAQGGKDREVWQHLQEGRAFLTTAVPAPHPAQEGNLLLPAPTERKRLVTPSTALGLQCSGRSHPAIGTASIAKGSSRAAYSLLVPTSCFRMQC